MKKQSLILFSLFCAYGLQAQTVKPCNIYPTNLESNLWWERYDDKTKTIHNVNLMVLTDGNNSNDKTGPFKVKLYLYNAEQYAAEKKIYYIKTYDIDNMSHMSAREANNQTVVFSDIDVPPNTYRLGIFVDADNEIAEPNENDNTMLFKGEIVIKTASGSQGSVSNNTPKEPTPQEEDPKQTLKNEKQVKEQQLENYTRTIVTKQAELSKLKKTASIPAYEVKIVSLEIEELEYRREEDKLAIERTNLAINDKLTANKSQEFVAEEQRYRLKAEEAAKKRTMLTNAKTQLVSYEKQVKDFDNTYTAKQSEVATANPQSPIEEINVKISRAESNEAYNRREAAKMGQQRVTKILSLTASESEISALAAQEQDFNTKANQEADNVRELIKERKALEKEQKKAANKEKLDNTKIKIKLDSTKRTLSGKEKNLEKELNKKKPNAEKIATMEAEIIDLKRKIAEMESQLK